MSFINHIILHWRRYSILERMLVIFPLTLVTPPLIPFVTSLTHDGETTHEIVATVYLFVTLGIGIRCDQWRTIVSPRIGSPGFFLACFTLWTGCSLIWTPNIGATLDQVVIWSDYTVLMLLAENHLRRRSIIGLGAMLMVVAGLMASIKLLGYLMVNGNQPENSPLFKNLGVETEILVTLISLFWVVYLRSRLKGLLIGSILGSSVCVMGSISTFQRTPLLALMGAIFGITFYILGGWFRPKSWNRVVVLILVICFSYAYQISLPANNEGLSGAQQLALKSVDETALKSSASGRFVLWDAALEMLVRHPFLGVGAGAYKVEYANCRAIINQQSHFPHQLTTGFFTPDQSDGAATYFRAHNEFLQVFGELGIIGGVLLILILFSFARKIFQLQASSLSVIVVCGGVAFLISSNFTSFSFRWIPCGLTFFLLMCLVSSRKVEPYGFMRRYSRIFHYFAVGCLLLSCVRSCQVFFSQALEAKAEGGISSISKENFKLALKLDPYNFTAQLKLGALYYHTFEPEMAVPLLESALNSGINDVMSFQTLALAQNQLGRWDKSEATLKRGLAMAPSSVFLRVVYAELLNRRGEAEGAKKMLEEARKINRTYADAAESLWQSEANSPNRYSMFTGKLGALWGIMSLNHSTELSYKKYSDFH